jgi:hypothetical protein
MKNRNYALLIFSIFLITSFVIFGCQPKTTTQESEAKMNDQQSTTSDKKQLRHVVLFKFKESTTQEDIAKVEEAFSALPGKIPQIKNFEWGINNSPEGLSKGYTHCFLLTFDSEKDRAVYLPHPAHKAFGQSIGMFIQDVLVIDYWN